MSWHNKRALTVRKLNAPFIRVSKFTMLASESRRIIEKAIAEGKVQPAYGLDGKCARKQCIRQRAPGSTFCEAHFEAMTSINKSVRCRRLGCTDLRIQGSIFCEPCSKLGDDLMQRKEQKPPQSANKVCVVCEKQFVGHCSAKTCSPECKTKHRESWKKWERKEQRYTCTRCNKVFVAKWKRSFCSNECQYPNR
jgi:hypothetical protein